MLLYGSKSALVFLAVVMGLNFGDVLSSPQIFKEAKKFLSRPIGTKTCAKKF